MLLTLQDDNHLLNQLGHSCLQIIEKNRTKQPHIAAENEMEFLAHVIIKQSIL